MKNLLSYILAILLLVPSTVFAVTVPWNRAIVGTITPLYTVDGILVTASSTFNANLSVSGLTSGNCVQASTGGLLTTIVGPCGSSTGITSLNTTYPILGGPITTTGTISIAFGTTTSNLWAGTQTFTNPIVDGTLTGLLGANNGMTYAVSTSTLSASISGNAGTATALAANGTNCSAGNYPLGVDASGNAESCTVANTGTVTAVTGTYPIISSGGTTPNLTFGGLSTSTAAVIGNIPYFSGVNTFANVATTSHAFSGPFTVSGTMGALVGGTNTTVNWTGLATTTQPSSSDLLVSNGGAGVYGVATTSETCSTGISCTAHAVLTGGGAITLASISAGVLGSSVTGIPTSQATSTLYGVGTGGQVLGWNNTTGGIGWVATSSSGGGAGTVTSITAGDGLLGGVITTSGTLYGQVGTSSTPVISSLSYWTSLGTATAPAKLGNIATTSATINNGLTGTLTTLNSGGTQTIGLATIAQGFLGNIGSASAVPTSIASSSIFSGTTGQNAYFSGTGALIGTSTIFTTTASAVGIGTAVPAAKLAIQATSTASTGQALDVWNSSLASLFRVRNDGNIGIGSTSPYALLSVNAQGGSAPLFSISSSTGKVLEAYSSPTPLLGVGTTTPTAALSVMAASTTAGTIQSTYNGMVAIIAGFENTAAKLFLTIDQWGRQTTGGDAPVLSSCGTTPSFIGAANDNTMSIQVGSVAATGCTATFAHAWLAAPTCNITERTGSVANAFSYTISTSAVVITQTGLTGDIIDVQCTGAN